MTSTWISSLILTTKTTGILRSHGAVISKPTKPRTSSVETIKRCGAVSATNTAVRTVKTIRTVRSVTASCSKSFTTGIAVTQETTMTPNDVQDDLGLSIDMTDVDRLRDWARNILTHGHDISEWGSVMFVASKMQIMATEMEKAVRDIGTLRSERACIREALVGLVGADSRDAAVGERDARLEAVILAIAELDRITDDIEAGYRNGATDDAADFASFKVIAQARALSAALRGETK
jgi:hypothetical protein